MNRRTLFTKLAYTAVALPLSWMGLNYLFPTLSANTKHSSKLRLGRIDELFNEKNYLLTRVGDIDAIVFKKENAFEAMSLQCTHAQCTVHYADDAKKFYCPCHGGEFNADGSVAKSPPQKPLQRLFLSVHDGWLFISDRIISPVS